MADENVVVVPVIAAGIAVQIHNFGGVRLVIRCLAAFTVNDTHTAGYQVVNVRTAPGVD